jgi:hypothetical protein
LTDSLDEAGSAFFSTPVNIQAFTTDFGFQNMDTETGGFTFTIQNDNPNALGKDGGSLGYSGIKNSIALKLDYNDGEGVNSTGLYINGAINGAPLARPSIDLRHTGINLHSGHQIEAHVTYDGTDLTLTLIDLETRATWSHAFPVNISAVVGGNTAYVGFTGGTGALMAKQELISWTYAAGQPRGR